MANQVQPPYERVPPFDIQSQRRRDIARQMGQYVPSQQMRNQPLYPQPARQIRPLQLTLQQKRDEEIRQIRREQVRRLKEEQTRKMREQYQPAIPTNYPKLQTRKNPKDRTPPKPIQQQTLRRQQQRNLQTVKHRQQYMKQRGGKPRKTKKHRK